MINVIGWLLFGLLVGALARLIHPGRDPMSWLMTIALGVTGSLLGGGIAYALRLGRSPYEPSGYLLAIVGAVVLLAIGLFATRTTTTPSRIR